MYHVDRAKEKTIGRFLPIPTKSRVWPVCALCIVLVLLFGGLTALVNMYSIKAAQCEKVLRDVPIPSSGYANGFDIYGQLSDFPSIEKAWSSSVFHGSGHINGTERKGNNASQHPKKLYSTEILALKALRNAVEDNCKKRLAKVDRLIAEKEGL